MEKQTKENSHWTIGGVQEAITPKVTVESVTTVCAISENERKKEITRMEMDRILFWE